MIKSFTTYIQESRETVDELEMLTPDQLGKLLFAEVWSDFPDIQYIKDLIAVGCPIDTEFDNMWTALHWAAKNGHLEIVKFLVSVGADVNATNIDNGNTNTPLHIASAYGESDVVKYLASKVADVNAKNGVGATALHLAAYNGYLDIVKSLISIGAEVNARNNEGQAALHSATMKDRLDIIKFLIFNGGDIHARDNMNRSAWDFAGFDIRDRLPELNPNK